MKPTKELLRRKVRVRTRRRTTKVIKKQKRIYFGVLRINATYNNVQVVFGDLTGKKVYFWVSSGSIGMKGTKKRSHYAARKVIRTIASKAYLRGCRKIHVYVRGPARTRKPAFRALKRSGLRVTRFCNNTPLPYNGCRPRKKRRT